MVSCQGAITISSWASFPVTRSSKVKSSPRVTVRISSVSSLSSTLIRPQLVIVRHRIQTSVQAFHQLARFLPLSPILLPLIHHHRPHRLLRPRHPVAALFSLPRLSKIISPRSNFLSLTYKLNTKRSQIHSRPRAAIPNGLRQRSARRYLRSSVPCRSTPRGTRA